MPTITYHMGREEFPRDHIACSLDVRKVGDAGGVWRMANNGPRFNAVTGYRPEIGGDWYCNTHDLAEGTVLMVRASRKTMSASQGYHQFIRVTDNAPHFRLCVPTARRPTSVIDNAMIEGRFEFLTPDEIQTLNIPPAYKFVKADPGVVVLTEVQAAPRQPVKPVVEERVVLVDGKEHMVATARRPRPLDLD